MSEQVFTESDRRIETLISRVLKIGVLCSVVLLAVGLVLMLRQDERALSTRIAGGGEFPRNWRWLIDALQHGRGEALCVVGLAVLLATPTLRVAVSIVVYALQGDRLYVVISTIVLLMLAAGFFLPH